MQVTITFTPDKAIVKLDVWDGKITTLEKVAVVDHVVYESNTDDRSVF